jgi:hypothetical protein
MAKVAQQNKALSEVTFNALPFEFHRMSIQVEQISPRKVCTRVAGKLEEHRPDENSLQRL